MSEQKNRLSPIEAQIRLGNYTDALEACREIITRYSNIKLEEPGTTTIHKQPWFLKAFGHKDIESVNNNRFDAIIIEKFKVKILESLCLFYLNKNELGKEKMDNTVQEIEKIKHKLYPNYKNDLVQFIEEIDEEIQELYLLSNYNETSDKKIVTEKIAIEKYLKMSENELLREIGSLIPIEVKTDSRVFNGKLLLLKSDSKILLPESLKLKNEKEIENLEFGKRLTNALKKSLYNIICDPKDRIGKKYISADSIKKLVSGAILSIGITSYPLIAPFVAFVLLFGIETYCEMSKPK